MTTPLANPRRTKLHAWPKRHEATPERDRSAAHASASDTVKHQPEKRTNQE